MSQSLQWRPTAPLSVLKKRADIFYQIREFFRNRQVLEVDTPILGDAGVSDPHIQNLITHYCTADAHNQPITRYLQTSPEYAMKRLLAAGSGSIYQLGKVFRDESVSLRHQSEFTMLEWYRVGWSDQALIEEVKELISLVLGSQLWTVISYKDLFIQTLNINPHTVSIDALQQVVAQFIHHDCQLIHKDQWLALLFSHVVEPELKTMGAVVVTQYPSSEAALAQTFYNEADELVAKRFEVYVDGLELANGYQELQDEQEQRQRFEQDQQKRKELNLPPAIMDEDLLAAMQAGLPPCAGVALGVDRLIMLSVGAPHITHVVPFGSVGNENE